MSKLRKTLSILVAVALVVTLLTPAAFAADNKVQRVAGENRYETSADIALDKFDSADTVIIVNGEDRFAYADGLAASVLAGALDAPILLTDANELSDAVAHAIEELGASKAYILGGTTAVSKAVEEALEDLDLDITRLDGKNRYETAALIAEEADTDSKTAYVVNGWANADAMVAGAAAFNNGNPILLVEKDNVRKETADALKALGIENVIIVGGTSVVSAAVANELDKDYDVKRIAGSGRYETSAVFAKETFNNPAGVSIVNGWRLADAIGASVYGNPILYANANGNVLDKPVENYLDELLEANQDLAVTLFGGPVALSNALQNAIQKKIDGEVPEELKVESVSAINATQIQISFNKAVEDANEIERAGNRIVVYKAGDTHTNPTFKSTAITFSSDKKSATVTLDGELVPGTKYTVALVDNNNTPSLAKIVAASEPTVLRGTLDTPSIGFTEKHNKIVVKFPKAMQSAALTATNYKVYDSNNNEVTGVFSGDGAWADSTTKTTVELPLATGKLLAGKKYTVVVNKANVLASDGSSLSEAQSKIEINTPTVAEAKPKVSLVQVTAEDEIKIYFDRDVVGINDVDEDLLTVKRSNGTEVPLVDGAKLEENVLTIQTDSTNGYLVAGSTYTVSLPANFAKNSYYSNALNDAVNLSVKAAENVAVQTMTAQFVRQSAASSIYDLVLTFDQPVRGDSASAAGDILIKEVGVAPYSVNAGATELYTKDSTGKSLVVKDVATKFPGFNVKAGKTYEIEVKEGTIKTNSISTPVKTNPEKLRATVTGINVSYPEIDRVSLNSAEQITVKFKETINAGALKPSHITVKGYILPLDNSLPDADPVDLTGTNQIKFTVSGDTITITPANDRIKFVTGTKVNGQDLDEIVTIAADTITGASGIANQKYVVDHDTTALRDNTAPIMIAAEAKDANTLEVLYTEDVQFKDTTPGTEATQFSVSGVKKNQVASAATITNNTITLTFTGSFEAGKDYSASTLTYISNNLVYVEDLKNNRAANATLTGFKNSVTP